MTTTLNVGSAGSTNVTTRPRPKLKLRPKAALPFKKKKKPLEKVVRNYTGREDDDAAKRRVMQMVAEYEKANGLRLTEQPGGLQPNTPQGTYKPGLNPKAQTQGTPGTTNQIKISSGGTTFVVTYVTASKGWCVYQQQQPGAKAQFKEGPLKSLKDAFAATAVYF